MRTLIIALLAAAALTGCGSTNWAGGVSTGAPIAPPGGGNAVVTGPQGAYASITIGGSAAQVLYWMTGAGIYAAMLMDDYRYAGPLFPAPMREGRTVAEVDCTKPLPEGLIGNVKCK